MKIRQADELDREHSPVSSSPPVLEMTPELENVVFAILLVLLLISPNRQERSRLVLRKTNFRCQQYHERQPGQRAVDEACLTEELILRS